MDNNQKFILNKIIYGLKSTHINRPLTDDDKQKLSANAESYKEYPQSVWDEWSRKIHWSLQVAFLEESDNLKNIDNIEVWRNNVISVVQTALEKDPAKQLVIDNAAFHFLKQDLLHHMVDIFGYNQLNEYEKSLVDIETGYAKQAAKTGCLLPILILIILIISMIVIF